MKPILFSTSMVIGIDEDRKTQTRRICKVDIVPSKMYENAWNFESKTHAAFNISIEELNTEFLGVLGLAKYKVGDILWVRETWVQWDYLRGEGFAVPFNGISVQTLINRGWITLK